MRKLEFYEPAMCCDTGLCGPGVDPELLRIATVMEDLAKAGACAARHNLKSEPGMFVTNGIVAEILKKQGMDALPLTLVDDEVVAKGSYPSTERLSELLGVKLDAAHAEKPACCGSADSASSDTLRCC